MGRRFDFEDEQYSVHVCEEGGHVDLHLQFKVPPPASPRPERPMGRGQRIVVAAHEHMRRQGILDDEMVILDQGNGLFEVSSRSEPGSWHVVLVEADREICQCTAARYRPHVPCRHVRGVRTLLGRPVDDPLPVNGTSADSIDFSLLTVEPTD